MSQSPLAQVHMFSADDAAAEKQAETETHTKEEIEKGRHEWGIKYDDECFKFEKLDYLCSSSSSLRANYTAPIDY